MSTTAESLWRVWRGKGHQTAAPLRLSGTGLARRRGRPWGPLGGGCPGPRWLAGTAAAAGGGDGDGDDASSLSHLWVAGRYASSGGGAPRLAAPPPGRRWRRCRWRRRWCWGNSACGSPAWQNPAPELLPRTESKGRMSRRWRKKGNDGVRAGCGMRMETLPQSRERIPRTNGKWKTCSALASPAFHVQRPHALS